MQLVECEAKNRLSIYLRDCEIADFNLFRAYLQNEIIPIDLNPIVSDMIIDYKLIKSNPLFLRDFYKKLDAKQEKIDHALEQDKQATFRVSRSS